ncbi:MAG: hypothetical protein AB1400_02180 [Pseudomonadota bacterium]
MKKLYLSALLAAGFIQIAGCTSPWPDAPAKNSPLLGLQVNPETASDNQLSAPKTKKIAWLPSVNSVQTESYGEKLQSTMQERSDYYAYHPELSTHVLVASRYANHNGFSADAVAKLLSKHFAKVERVNKLEEVDSRYDYVAVIDVSYSTTPITPNSHPISTAEVRVIFLDNKLRSVAEASGQSVNTINSSMQLYDTHRQALNNFESDFESKFPRSETKGKKQRL